MNTENLSCIICKQPIHLQSATTDDQGNPVHEECYAAARALNTALRKEAAVKNVSPGKSPRLSR